MVLDSTAALIAVTGILAPILEESVFRGFLMTSLTKWYCSTSLICLPSSQHVINVRPTMLLVLSLRCNNSSNVDWVIGFQHLWQW